SIQFEAMSVGGTGKYRVRAARTHSRNRASAAGDCGRHTAGAAAQKITRLSRLVLTALPGGPAIVAGGLLHFDLLLPVVASTRRAPSFRRTVRLTPSLCVQRSMARDFLKNVSDQYDVVVIGSGLAGMTSANILGRAGHRVLLLEQHYKLGGLATWFLRPGGHIFDISLHGFPHGMIKSCRRYWNDDIADRIIQLKNIRFDNPMFSLTTTFNRADFTQLLTTRFGLDPAVVTAFFDTARGMNFYDDQTTTTRDLFDRFFPGREDVVRLLMEPITYANGSTLEDPAITYGIVFSNFMSKGVFIYQGGTDDLVNRMKTELQKNNVDIAIRCGVDRKSTR